MLLRRSRKAPRACSSRSVAASVFFVGPTELPSDGPAHGRDRHPDARLLFPQLAVAPERGVVVLFELAPQEPLLFEGGEDAPSSARRNPGREVLALPPHLQPAFEGGKGDGEDLHDLLPPWDAPIHRRQSPDPYVLRVDAHARHPYMGPSYSQAALAAPCIDRATLLCSSGPTPRWRASTDAPRCRHPRSGGVKALRVSRL
jgi:hypothetical protein